MSRGSRDGGKPPHETSQTGPTSDERRRHTRQRCELPVRIVAVESSGSESGSQLFRVYSGWQCDISAAGVGFVTSASLSCDEVFLELRSPNHGLTFQAARIVHAQEAQNGLWRYGAYFVEPVSRVDRYEFD